MKIAYVLYMTSDRLSSNKSILYHFWADKEKFVKGPLGLNGATGKTISKYHQTLLNPKNHRFASYVSVLKKFP